MTVTVKIDGDYRFAIRDIDRQERPSPLASGRQSGDSDG